MPFGYDSASAPDIVDFTAPAYELDAIYRNINSKNQWCMAFMTKPRCGK